MKRWIVLVVLAACGSDPKQPTTDPRPPAAPDARPMIEVMRCPDESWGGFDGDGFDGMEACAETAARTVLGNDRACETDADCVLLGTNCDPHAVSSEHAAGYDWPAPCTDPRSGECMGPNGAACVSGCCTPQ